MDLLHPLTDFGPTDSDWRQASNPAPSYWYTGQCPQTGHLLRLPRTAQIEAIAHALMHRLRDDAQHPREGKMYGVLLIETSSGAKGILKAFSGCLKGQRTVTGWVPPIPGRSQVALAETQTLTQLAQLKADIIALQAMPERAEHDHWAAVYADRLQTLAAEHRDRKQARNAQRQTDRTTLQDEALADAHNELIKQSQRDGIERRRLKRERDAILTPLREAIGQADQQLHTLKHQRKALSRQLQAQMHAVYSLTNFAGMAATLQDLIPTGLPTGTGDCAAPKLLHYAATHHLKPLALAEFWLGLPQGDKHPGQFYGACVERCQPIMGFLLSGLPQPPPLTMPVQTPLPILYRDEALIIIDKPTGLLSVPGRTSQLQDSVLSRLRCQLTEYPWLKAVHRLDKGTSGVFVIAASAEVHRRLSQQFAQRQVQKTYEAILTRPIQTKSGVIDLPLWRNPRDRPKQSVDVERGKPSQTQFVVMEFGAIPRIQFRPQTGRTHQLRVHAAHPLGLNSPILGDNLYGTEASDKRLHLHAKTLEFVHPITSQIMHLHSPAPF